MNDDNTEKTKTFESLDKSLESQASEKDFLENKENDSKENSSLEKEYLEKINYLENQLKLSVADFSNYKKRILKEQENISFQENSKIILEFLSFKEILLKAIEHEENQSAKNNLKELDNNFENILRRLKIQKIELQEKDFDYNLAECLQAIKVEDKSKHNKVIEVLENGYTFKEKVIKPGKVVIGNYMEE